MNFRDRWEENERGERFVFTVEMQRKLSQAGLPIDPAYLGQLAEMPAARPARESYSSQPSAPSQSAHPPQRERERERERGPEVVGPETIQIDPQTGKYIGRVKWYNAKKGYGFIVRGAGEEIFFHKSAAVTEVEEYQEGEWVLYDVETTAKGPEASDIEPYTGEPIV
jgi:CspA family cold shock protein